MEPAVARRRLEPDLAARTFGWIEPLGRGVKGRIEWSRRGGLGSRDPDQDRRFDALIGGDEIVRRLEALRRK